MDENPTCEFCSVEQPSLTCSDCSLNLCEACCARVHSKGKLADHKFTSYRCEVCNKLRCEVDCFSCDVGFCAPCYIKLHSRGAMALHVRAPREPVDPGRQAVLDGLSGQAPQQLGNVTNAEATVAGAAGSTAAQPRSVTWTSPSNVATTTTSIGGSTGSATTPSGTAMFCDGTCKTCAPAPTRPGYGLPRHRKMRVEGEDEESTGEDDEAPPQAPPTKLDEAHLASLPCQHRVNQRLFSYRKTGDGWVGRELVGNVFSDYQNQTTLQFEVREDGIFCNICPPNRAPFSVSGDVSNLRSHAKCDLHLNHLTLRLTGQWPSCKPTGMMPDGSSSTNFGGRTVASSTPVIVSPPETFTPSHGNKGFRSPKQLFTPQEHELLMQLGEECGWSKRSNNLIEKFAEQHGILPRRVKAWIGNHKPTRKKYRYYASGSQSSSANGSSGGVFSESKHLQGNSDLTMSVASSGEDGVTSYTVTPAMSLGDQSTTTVTLLPQLPIPGEVVLPESS